MAPIEKRIEILRKEMEEKYLEGDKDAALAISQRLDKLIALAQRERGFGEVVLLGQSQSSHDVC